MIASTWRDLGGRAICPAIDQRPMFADPSCPDLAVASVDSPSDGPPLSLATLPIGTIARVVGVQPPEATTEARELALRLLEIGFIAGERVRVIAHGHPGREPIAVRVGGTTFALRRFEAEQVLVACQPSDTPAR